MKTVNGRSRLSAHPGARHRTWTGVAVLAAALVLGACSGATHHKPMPPARTASPTSSAADCATSVRTGVLPTWAQGGFTPRTQSMPYVLGTNGDIVGILFGEPLRSPPRPAPGPFNKILWVSRVATNGDALKIEARLGGSHVIATRTVAGGPGPSIIDLPGAGCWNFSLSWSGHLDRMSIPYHAG
jgi:hypothetical protein